MSGMMTVKEASKLWGLSNRRVTALCKDDKIKGVRKEGRSWLIPLNTPKPVDHRVKSGMYRKNSTPDNLPLPIGISDYRLASTEYYYIDKTMMIKEFLDERPMVSLFTRPRRFGKTLNMDMVRTFFEKTNEDTSIYFKDKLIWKQGEKYCLYQGKYPVIFITLKDVKCNNWEETYNLLTKLIRLEFIRHSELSDSTKVSDQAYYHKIISEQANENDYRISLMMLSQMLDEHYQIAPIVIIDEYDTPIQQGYLCGFYEEVIQFMRNFFSGGLKDNRHLSYGFLTGILRVAKESIFSGLNNLKVNSIMDTGYSKYFGFTRQEVEEMADYYGVPQKVEEICKWYDGYRFGDTEIFNPWSVINYFGNQFKAKAFWQSTGNNEIIGEILTQADEQIYERLHALLRGEQILTYIDTGVIYPEIKDNPSSIYSFLLVAGYLKAVMTDEAFGGDYMCKVSIPNQEIAHVYRKEILQKLRSIMPPSTAILIQEALYTNNASELKEYFQKLLIESASSFDTVGESFYHGLVLGLCAMLDDYYYVTSNRESGEGRYDIQLMPRDPKRAGIIIELKARSNCAKEALRVQATEARCQIDDKKYDTDMLQKGIKTILKYGVAFSGKTVEIVT